MGVGIEFTLVYYKVNVTGQNNLASHASPIKLPPVSPVWREVGNYASSSVLTPTSKKRDTAFFAAPIFGLEERPSLVNETLKKYSCITLFKLLKIN